MSWSSSLSRLPPASITTAWWYSPPMSSPARSGTLPSANSSS